MVTTDPGEEPPASGENLQLPATVSGFSPRRVALVAKAAKDWAAQLIDLGARNNLLRFRDLKMGTLDLTSAEAGALSLLLQGRAVRLSQLFPDALRREDARRRVRAIHSKAKENFEERGLDTLHLACGLASWDNPRGSWQPSSPVLLRPAVLKPLGASHEDFELTLFGEMVANQSLLQLLKVDFSLDCEQSELMDQVEGVIDEQRELEAVYDWLTREAAPVNGFHVEPRVVLANFAYAKLPMVKDLEVGFDELGKHDLIAAIAGDEEARSIIRSQMPDEGAVPSPDDIRPADEFLVLDADTSQSYAINAALAGESLIVNGPPGTGKSQTIANLIAALLARRKTVLFVAEKRAAIDAVLKRLRSEDLAGLVLDLHGGVSSRRAFAQELDRTLASIRAAAPVDRVEEQRRLEARRAELNAYEHALHDVREPWGKSIYQVLSELASIPEGARADTRLRGAVLTRLDKETTPHVRETLASFVRLGGLSLAGSTSPWARAKVFTAEQVQAAFACVDTLRRETVPIAKGVLTEASAGTGIDNSGSIADWQDRLALWADVAKVEAVFRPEVFEHDLDQLCNSLAPARRGVLARINATITSRGYRTALRTARGLIRSSAHLDGGVAGAVRTANEVRHRWKSAASTSVPATPADLTAVQSSYERLLGELEGLEQFLLPDGRLSHLTFQSLDALLRRLTDDRGTLAKLPEFYRLSSELESAGLNEFLTAVKTSGLGESDCLSAFRNVWLRSILESVELSDLRIGGFSAAGHQQAVDEFQDVDRDHVETTASRIKRACAESATIARDKFPNQADLVRRQASLKRKNMSVREMMGAAPDVLLALKPCWAMSPLLVSQLLPARKCFDVVIFDEASQIMPADAATSVLRGGQLIVAGDEKQLPPTTFFAAETRVDEDESDATGEESLFAGVRDFESILDLLNSLLRFRTLEWHYRSRDERLIAFSNAYIYSRMLTTFPGAIGGDCVSCVGVPWRSGDETNSPSAEVEAAVEAILDHAATRPDESLGVITMGIKHANRVDAALRLRLPEHPELDEFFSEDREERFFVKNLERVQGDERDAIILSVGYGKNQNGTLVYKFGPITREGGERRLNVAITRAKKRLSLIASFSSDDVDPQKLNSEGMRLLRAYIQYCESGARSLGDLARDNPALNPFEIDVRDTLTGAGLRLIPQYGSSGYWIDFAVQHPDQPGRFVLAIECDGAMYHSSPSARDRDRLRQEQLERRGWCFHRIWSTDWFHNKNQALERAVLAYRRALQENGASREVKEVVRRATGPQSAPVQPRRSGPRPSIARGLPIHEYAEWQLVKLAKWIASDEVLRTEEELFAEMMQDLGFHKRGSRIRVALRDAIRRART